MQLRQQCLAPQLFELVVQYDTLQATAMPAGPHGNATTKDKAVAADSITVQRSQRPGFPIERWIQPTVL